MKDKITDANFPLTADGRVYHVSIKAGEVANRIITAGDANRVRRFATFLDPVPQPFELSSDRFPMVDFLVREVRAVTEGDLAIIRFGSCGSLDPTLPVGSLGVPKRAMTIMTNYDHWHAGEGEVKPAPYIFSKPIPSDPVLHQKLLDSLAATVASPTCQVRDLDLHASADLFYSSQGRIDANFSDSNSHLLTSLSSLFPTLSSLEMETAHLFHLAQIASPLKGTISAAAAHMIFAARNGEGATFIEPDQVEFLEKEAGRTCLDAVVAFEIGEERLHPEEGSVWKM
ncbi:hypothetical protein RQP46_004326 [Phenoliferia psychrophenolica]